MLDDKQIVDACIKGVRTAQYQLYERYSGKLYALSLRYIKDKDDAKDVLQNAFIKIYENLNSFRQDCPLEAWMKRIVINTALRAIQNKKEFIELDQAEIRSMDMSYSENLGLQDMNHAQLLDLVHSLPDGCRTIFNLYAIEGFKHQEIAEMLGLTEGTSKSQYARAKELLIKKIEQEKRRFSDIKS
jgi:RNA polymerase sigma factor (sigma-70 family)